MKGRGEVYTIIGHEDTQDYGHTSTLSLTSMRRVIKRHAQAALPPGNDPEPIAYEAGWGQGRSGRVRKISPHTKIRSPDRPDRSELLYRLRYRDPSN
jgi:hypothetical protein